MSARCLVVCSLVFLLFAGGANAARYQRTKDGKTLVWNSLRGVAQEVTWSGLRDLNGYATGEGTLTWYRLGIFINSYTGKMVRGKFEGPVVRVQGNTKLQATFANGDKVSNWLEPGSTERPTSTPAPTESPTAEAEIEEESFSSPTPKPLPTFTPFPTPTPSPTAQLTPIATPTQAVTPRPTPTPAAFPTSTPTPQLTPSPTTATTVASLTPSPIEGTGKKDVFSMEGRVPELQGLEFAAPSSKPANTPQEMPRPEASPTPRTSPAESKSASSQQIDENLKRQMIEDLKKQTQLVLAQVSDATRNFREIDRLDQVQALPAAVSTRVTLLGNRARDFRAKVGYEVAYYECLTEIETIDALVVVDEVTRDLAAKDAPAARKMLVRFVKSYSKPSADNLKSLWVYLNSTSSLCDRQKDDAAAHLQRARSLESAGKKSEALSEYREIYRIYPNPITADKIKQLQNKPR